MCKQFALFLCLIALCFAQYTGYPQMGSMTLKLLVKGTPECGSSDALAARLVSSASSITAYSIKNASVTGKAPKEKLCSPPPPPPAPASASTGSTQPSTPPVTISTDPVKVTVFSGQPHQTDVVIAPYGQYRLQFTITSSHSGMIAIGFPKDKGLMINSDAVIGWPKSASAPSNIADYSIGTERSSDCTSGGICKDWLQNIGDAEVTVTNGVTTLKFMKSRVPEDSNDVTFVGPMEYQDINIALGASPSLSYHSDKRTSTTIMIPGPVPEPSTTISSTASNVGQQPRANGMAMDNMSTILFIVLGVLGVLLIVLIIAVIVRKARANPADEFGAYTKL